MVALGGGVFLMSRSSVAVLSGGKLLRKGARPLIHRYVQFTAILNETITTFDTGSLVPMSRQLTCGTTSSLAVTYGKTSWLQGYLAHTKSPPPRTIIGPEA